ncbi:Mfa1 family fimbria major subunit [Phocaeicola sp.]|uniref:Mfa1 family fimbria major subunit n=1 Tax=Phocaeicola sp. TaxID=2773926 RepID=UPI0023C214DF|nr:Mfa1 family fimbria major subunit [Phocaeicola sp.]MDE5678100.1 Mfa1 family fimbria major subunit [Phocaeicola sp.]
MKKRHFLMAGLAAMFMASCSDNELNQIDDSFIVDGNYKAYFKVAISNPPSTNSRALNETNGEEFANGEGEESEIENILFVFYNRSRNYVAHTMMSQKDFGSITHPGTGSSIETTVGIVIPVEESTDAATPYYVMAYVNPTQDNSTDNLESVANFTRNSYLNTNGKFIMNNSTYYSGTGNTLPSCATLIGDKIYKTSTEAALADAINIYVERLAAKVNVAVKNNANLDSEKDNLANGYTLTFTPKAWGLNGTARQSFLVKQFRVKDEAETLGDKLTYSTIDESLNNAFSDADGTAKSWNDKDSFRSYWCLSNYYASGKYPSTTYDLTEGNTYSLEYHSYADIVRENTTWSNEPQYCMEHTINALTLNSPQSKAAITSVIVVGDYQLKTTDGNEIAEGTTFYRQGTSGEDTDKRWNIYLKDDMVKKFAANQMSVYKRTNENGEDVYTLLNGESEMNDLNAIFTIGRPNSTVLNGVKLPERFVTLQAKETDIPAGYCIRNNDGTYTPISANNVDAVNSALFSACGTAEMYNAGKAYFNIPIAHFGNTTADKEIGVGYYGVVRNHAYNIVIEGISGMGTGIGDPTHPIVPPTEETTYYVKTQINVLAWRVAADQNVTLGE